ncbi:MAG: class I SAM-dependent methyltransferase [Flavobacteriales bacterium]|nr:class I SAM-dependent methyltransferase [Flavobacteriales bacterium]MDG1781196.1 class I SAM-dependent methyltransferase [Flavobacteriales bacterium]MDG2245827.1 class I SAM-dependent methyltransferase [Flavobacteriales bacterium]
MAISNIQIPSLLKKKEVTDDKVVFRVRREAVSCVNCGSDDHDVVHHFDQEYYNHDKFETYSWDGGVPLDLTIVKCKGCETVFQSPRFCEESLHYLYPNHPLPEKLSYKRQMQNHKFHFLIDMIREHGTKSLHEKTAVDLGTRYGVLPELLANEGYRAMGVEMNLKCVKIANQAGFEHVHQGTIADIDRLTKQQGMDRVNLVTMVDIVEHLLDPRRDFELISRHQQSGDQIFISTMDVESLGHKIFGKNWYFLHAQHTYYFSEKMLGDLLDKFGYDIQYVHRIAKFKNLSILPKELKKHNALRAPGNSERTNSKRWFAEYRPSLFDYINIVAVKR